MPLRLSIVRLWALSHWWAPNQQQKICFYQPVLMWKVRKAAVEGADVGVGAEVCVDESVDVDVGAGAVVGVDVAGERVWEEVMVWRDRKKWKGHGERGRRRRRIVAIIIAKEI